MRVHPKLAITPILATGADTGEASHPDAKGIGEHPTQARRFIDELSARVRRSGG